VLGRKIEQAMLAQTVAAAEAHGVRRLVGLYVPTAKNGMVEAHYEQLGFQRVSRDNDGRTVWLLNIADYVRPDLPMLFEEPVYSGATETS
ncbi:MAG TPA: hypothetical protein VGG69_09015, partial [Rhizomicrobium sp.]